MPHRVFFPLFFVNNIILLVSSFSFNHNDPLHIDIPCRAYLPAFSKHRSKLEQELLSLSGMNATTTAASYVEASISLNQHQHHCKNNGIGIAAAVDAEKAWHSLPASKITLVAHTFDTNNQNHDLIDRNWSCLTSYKMQKVIMIWNWLGNKNNVSTTMQNSNYTGDDAMMTTTTFSLSFPSTTSNNKSRRRGKKKQSPYQVNKPVIVQKLSQYLSKCFGWTKCNHGNPDLDFVLTRRLQSDEEEEEDRKDESFVFDLELLALSRTYPLSESLTSNDDNSNNNKKRKQSKRKRLESFVLAKTARIEPHDVVLDPICKRGTILIEAAKYWPLAAKFIGIDSNLGNLDHARMNADSTFTSLDLFYVSAVSSITNINGSILVPMESVDKIMTCLPFLRTKGYYQSLLEDWANVLKPDCGKIVTVIDQASLSSLLDAIEDASNRFKITAVRNQFVWGKYRACIICADRTPNICTTAPPASVSLLDWENTGDQDDWAQVRSDTMPPLVPVEKVTQGRRCSNKVWLPQSQKVYSSQRP